ncbi:MAG: tetratricopeptide repeat protein [Bacteroidetes bacterium]|nr:tetratricopeptide repeat protein [Bacteroidota bacterium]MBT3750928.1 tetratricopeptide repeat protein [Bacteroidota bacterium]MBT4409287.1 tetratricopeptide repeat protein [Bacteroidota bacterium]MBT7095197.1 tetratricopeptide repeat protein [Bacteroidota bacterium]MBT7463878.1 tetratricopeptide repeat protein [Bacteroidota bacterium]
MKLSPNLSKHPRIILLFILGLFLPGMILGFFAFRGLQNDQALVEKQNQQELKLLAIDVFSKLDKRIKNITTNLIDNPKAYHPIILIAWEKQNDANPTIIQGQMANFPDGSLPYEIPDSKNKVINEVNKLEFSRHDYPLAISRYKEIINTDNIAATKIQALLGLGRIYKKTKQFDQAIETYQTLISNHPNEMLLERLPVKALGLLELIRLYHQTGDSITGSQISDELFRFLMSPSIKVEKTPYEYLVNEWKKFKLDIHETKLKSLEDIIKLTNHLHQINGMSTGLMADKRELRFIDSDLYPGLIVHGTDSSQSEFAWVMSADSIIKQELPAIFNLLDPEGVFSWNVIKEENPSSAINFPVGYPPWRLQIDKQDLATWERLFKTSQGVLLLVFVFIFLLMIAGLVFMLYTLNQQMRLNKMKSHFISNVSHEFKTPLTSIRHMTEIMHLKRIDSEDRKEEYLHSMLEQCDHLGHLIENILDFSKMEEDIKNYRFEAHQINEILSDLIPVFKGRIPDESFELNLRMEDRPPHMMLDKDAILQVFYNLLDNAYKYSEGGSKIDLSLSLVDQKQQTIDRIQAEGLRLRNEGKSISISVRDYGMGISEKDLGRIFERFYRGDKLRIEGIKGSGIGLTIVKRIVEAHGGQITVESEIDKGTTFTVILPINSNES